jgi:[acyl-carrier-protein] S-malonyltransferase
MAGDFIERFPASAAIFDEASATLEIDVRAICLSDDPRLHLTEFTQPCILTAEIAMLTALREHFGLDARRYGGHSLGEYTALVAARALPFAAALRLVRLRGRLMQGAVPVGQGGMVAVVQQGLDLDLVSRVAADAEIDVANYNSPSQVVLSGATAGLARVTAILEEKLAPAGGRVVPLEVSAPFHSRALRVIEPEFHRALEREAEHFDASRATAVTSNFLGAFHGGQTSGLIDALTRQISGSVRWISNMNALAEGAQAIYEVGPNKPLSRFFKEMGRDVGAILNVRSAEKLLGNARVS